MVRTLVVLLLVVCLGMMLTIGASPQEPPGNQQIQYAAVREIALVAVGLLGGWGGAFISGLWSSKTLDKRLEHEAEQNRLSREEQRQQLATQLTMQQQIQRDQLEHQTREYMREFRQQRVGQLFEMIVALGTATHEYDYAVKSGKLVDPSEYEMDIERRQFWASFLLGSAELREKSKALLGEYLALLKDIEKKPLDDHKERFTALRRKENELATLAERYIASG